jgi:hypothetical protein
MMRQSFFLALAYLVGIHGFVFFAPYLVLVTGGVHLIRIRRRSLKANWRLSTFAAANLASTRL